MPERIQKLRAKLAELETELGSLASLDDESLARLRETIDEIRTALEEDAASLAGRTFTARLTEAARGFENSHPTLFRTVGNIVDALGQLGI